MLEEFEQIVERRQDLHETSLWLITFFNGLKIHILLESFKLTFQQTNLVFPIMQTKKSNVVLMALTKYT